MSARPAPPSLLGNTLGLRSLLVMLYHLLRHMISAVFSGLWPTEKQHDVTAVYGTARPSAVVTGADTGIGQYLSVHLASQVGTVVRAAPGKLVLLDWLPLKGFNCCFTR